MRWLAGALDREACFPEADADYLAGAVKQTRFRRQAALNLKRQQAGALQMALNRESRDYFYAGPGTLPRSGRLEEKFFAILCPIAYSSNGDEQKSLPQGLNDVAKNSPAKEGTDD